MKLRHYRLGVVTLLVAAVMLALWSAPEIRADRADDAVRLAGKMLTSKNPDKRAEAVEQIQARLHCLTNVERVGFGRIRRKTHGIKKRGSCEPFENGFLVCLG